MLGSHRRGVKGKCLAVCCRGGIFLAIIDSQGNGKGLLDMYEYKHCFEDSAVHSKVPALCPLRNHKYVRVKTADIGRRSLGLLKRRWLWSLSASFGNNKIIVDYC